MEYRKVYWSFQNFSKPDQNRTFIFNANEVIFTHSGDNLLPIIINDIYILKSGEQLKLRCQEGEVDITAYRFSFPDNLPDVNINSLMVAYK